MTSWLTTLQIKSHERLVNKALPRDLVRESNLLQAVIQPLDLIDARIIDIAGSELVEPIAIDPIAYFLMDGGEGFAGRLMAFQEGFGAFE